MTFVPAPTLFDEVTDFLLANPSPQDIINFRASETLDERLHSLLDKKKLDALSADEQIELDTFIKIGHLLTMLKAKARLKVMRDS